MISYIECSIFFIQLKVELYDVLKLQNDSKSALKFFPLFFIFNKVFYFRFNIYNAYRCFKDSCDN